jgi:hypothetical protein
MAATENREEEYLWEMDYREGVDSDFSAFRGAKLRCLRIDSSVCAEEL